MLKDLLGKLFFKLWVRSLAGWILLHVSFVLLGPVGYLGIFFSW